MKLFNGVCSFAIAIVAFSFSSDLNANIVDWTDWTSSDGVSATGDLGGVTITYTGELDPFPQTDGGLNYWATSSSTYTSSPTVDNPPPNSDIIRLTGLSATPNVITFSEPVHDPVMAILSLGRPTIPVSYDFDSPFDILNVGPGHFGNGTLVELNNDILVGREGHGLIQFQGVFSSISWTVAGSEVWHGFTIGATSVPEPGSLALLGIALVHLTSRRYKR